MTYAAGVETQWLVWIGQLPRASSFLGFARAFGTLDRPLAADVPRNFFAVQNHKRAGPTVEVWIRPALLLADGGPS